jgi:hypothetical protein
MAYGIPTQPLKLGHFVIVMAISVANLDIVEIESNTLMHTHTTVNSRYHYPKEYSLYYHPSQVV